MTTSQIMPQAPATQSAPRLRTLLTAQFFGLAILTVIAVIATLYIGFSRQIRQDLRLRATNLAAIAALQQNGDELTLITSENDPIYQKVQEQNTQIARIDPDIAYVYIMRKNEQGIYFVVDAAGINYQDTAAFGEPYPDSSTTLRENFDTLENPIADEDIYTDSFGSFLSGYAPIRNSQGETVGVIGVDLSAESIIQKERQFLLVALLVLVLSLLVISVAGLIIGIQISKPLNLLTQSAKQIASGDLSHRISTHSQIREIDELSNYFNKMTISLQETIDHLESRVEERTAELQQRTSDLENQSQKMTRRANQLRAVAMVARTISSIQDLQSLLSHIATVVSKEFSFYHVGIFLLDDSKEYAVLAASNSEGGQRMLERNHKLKVGEQGIVGFSAATGQVRVALDTKTDTVYFDNPDLPNTRSEMALPLFIGENIIGVLDIQSEQTEAFQEDDIEFLSIVADQISIAIQNARQFQEAQKATQEAEEIYRRYIRGEWRILTRETGRLGYRYSKAGVGPLKARIQSSEVAEVSTSGKTSASKKETRSQIVVPIKLRGEVIGILNVVSDNEKTWDQDEVDITEAIAERVGLAIENVRLLEASQAQTVREKTISAITSRISASVNMSSILQTAVEELGQIIPGSEVIIQLGKENNNRPG